MRTSLSDFDKLQQIRLDMTFSITLPIAFQGVIAIMRSKGLIYNKIIDNSLQIIAESKAMTAFRFAFIVTLK